MSRGSAFPSRGIKSAIYTGHAPRKPYTMSKRKALPTGGPDAEWKQNPMQAINNHKFINDPSNAVVEALQGFVQAQPNCQLLDGLPDIKVVVRANTLLSNVDKNKVAIASGGGSGHEPAHAGFVGEGLLNAAVCGDVFASPSVDAVLAAIRHVCGPNGCLLIVKNYTGDRLNFGLAAERAKLEGYKVEMVVVGDDCSLPPPLGVAGRRGLCGTLFVHKVAGAAANSGLNLNAVKLEAMEAASCVGTVGVAIAAHTLPGSSAPARLIPSGQMEVGLGIHGEPGAFTEPVMDVVDTVDLILKKITDESHGYMKCLEGKMEPPKEGLEKIETTEVKSPKNQKTNPAPKVAVMVNSLGAVSLMELQVVTKACREWLKNRGLNPCRVFVGNFMTALNMTGFSISLMVLDQQRLGRLDAELESASWPQCARSEAKFAPLPVSKSKVTSDIDQVAVSKQIHGSTPPKPVGWMAGVVLSTITAASKELQKIEPEITDADTKVGDGDCGVTFARGASGLLEDAPHICLLETPRDVSVSVGLTVRRSMGGTSGALYDIFFSAAGVAMENKSADDPMTWFTGFEAGILAMKKYGNALPGNRTMLDALVPAMEAARGKVSEGRVSSSKEALEDAAKAAEEGAASTRTMRAGAGRSSYVPEHVLLSVADPGATATAAWLRAVANAAQEYL